MINKINYNSKNINQVGSFSPAKIQSADKKSNTTSPIECKASMLAFKNRAVPFNTKLNGQDLDKYNFLLNFLKDVPVSLNAFGQSSMQQMDTLLKNGKLLSKANDKSSMLDNLYLIATTKRADKLDSKKIISNVLDATTNPRIVTQTFGDIPENMKQEVLKQASSDSLVKENPNLMNVSESGTCAAASNEVNLADKFPAEFTRWANGLSSAEKAVYVDVDLSALSPNKLDAINILDLMEAKKVSCNLNKAKIKVSPDDNAYIRAALQTNNWDKGERTPVDVLIQSAIMQAGSQNTYDSLTDIRGGKFSQSPQGLIEIEKTYVESLLTNRETTSLVYQIIDQNQNLVGASCSPEKITQHIKSAIDNGNNVINGYVLTNETSGRTKLPMYSKEVDGDPKKVINGHEITIVDYKIDESGKTKFICIDTDDDTDALVEYDADWLVPKIHHAGYQAQLVAADEKEIMEKANSI